MYFKLQNHDLRRGFDGYYNNVFNLSSTMTDCIHASTGENDINEFHDWGRGL